MKVLVTGATGFLGSYLCRRLARDGYKVAILRRPNSDTSPLDGLNLQHLIADITEFEAVKQAIKGQDMIIHSAALIDDSKMNQEILHQINVAGSRNVAKACKEFGIKRLLHVSSVAAIGIPDSKHPADETFSFNLAQRNLGYHKSKHLAEKEILREVDSGLDAVIVNPGMIFGFFKESLHGSEMIDKVHQNKIMPYCLGGICSVHVEDVADGIIQALRNGKRGERYILGGENISFRRISEVAARFYGLERIFLPLPPYITASAALIFEILAKITKTEPLLTLEKHYYTSHYHYYNSNKARRELGYNPRSFEDIVQEYITSQKGSDEK